MVARKLGYSSSTRGFYHSVLRESREHDNDTTLPIVEQLQQVPCRGGHGALSNHVRLLVLVALNRPNVTQVLLH